MKKEFIKFLKKHRVYTAFIKCCKEDNRNFNLDVYINQVSMRDYISSGFCWSHDRQKEKPMEFWCNLDRQWRVIVHNFFFNKK